MILTLLRSIGGKVAGWGILITIGVGIFLWMERLRAQRAAAEVALRRAQREREEHSVAARVEETSAAANRVVDAAARLDAIDDKLRDARESREAMREAVGKLMTPASLEDRARKAGV